MSTHKLKVLITGITSIHGWPIFEMYRNIPDAEVLGIRSPKMKVPSGNDTVGLCITEKSAFLELKHRFKPDAVIHAAGVCDLDVCEERPSWAYSMNVTGAQVIADVFGKECFVVYLSSDLVFSGNNPPASGYTEECLPDPVSVAGKTIELAEREISRSDNRCIIRLGLPIGPSITCDKGAVDFIDSRLRRSLPLTLFHDEYRSCIDCRDICKVLKSMVKNRIGGLFHLGGPHPYSLFEIGEWVGKRNNRASGLLKGISRFDERNGPPRIGNVCLNSGKIKGLLGIGVADPIIQDKVA